MSIQLVQKFTREINTSYNDLYDKVLGWVHAIFLHIPNILLAIIVAILGYFFAKFTQRLARRFTSRFTNNETVLNLVQNVTNVIIFMIMLFLILGIFDLDGTINKILATAGVLGLAVGLALQDPLINLFSGVIMSVKSLYKIGDIVETNGYHGIIRNISLGATTIETFDGQQVTLPNKVVVQNPLTNYSVMGIRRVAINIGVSYTDDLDKVKEITMNAIKSLDTVIQHKSIELFFHTFSDSSINFDVIFWHIYKQENDYRRIKSEAIQAIKKAYDEHNITIPFPIRTLEISKMNENEAPKTL